MGANSFIEDMVSSSGCTLCIHLCSTKPSLLIPVPFEKFEKLRRSSWLVNFLWFYCEESHCLDSSPLRIVSIIGLEPVSGLRALQVKMKWISDVALQKSKPFKASPMYSWNVCAAFCNLNVVVMIVLDISSSAIITSSPSISNIVVLPCPADMKGFNGSWHLSLDM